MTTNNNESLKKKKQGSLHKNDLNWDAFGRVPPHSKDIEEAVLGAIMIEKQAYIEISEVLKPEHFYIPNHQSIYQAFQDLEKRNAPIDLYTVVDYLNVHGKLNEDLQPYHISQLTKNVVSGAHIQSHAGIILQKFVQRELIKIANAAIFEAFDGVLPSDDLIDKIDGQLSAINNANKRGAHKDIAELAMQAVTRIDYLRANKGMFTGIPSGFKPLDAVTNGWQPTDLIIIAARPSVGKTAFALNLAINAVESPIKPTPCGFFSLEMSADQMTNRIISSKSHINLKKITNGKFETEDEYKRFVKTASEVSELKLFIDDTGALSINEFKSRARRLVRDHNVGIIIIDYLQLMAGKTNDVQNREGEISNISRNLKALAKELNIPIIALSQLSREIEKRRDGEPQLSDLRESGAIEQDADLVAFLTRLSYQKEEGQIDPMLKDDTNVWIKKHRNGELVKLAFKTVLAIQKWFDLDGYDAYTQLPSEGKWQSVNNLFTNTGDSDPEEDLPF